MEINVDLEKLNEGKYDEKGFAICKCGKHRYATKKMLVEFLKPLSLPGTAEIWSRREVMSGQVDIFLKITYQVGQIE
jgi:hypothetical protein